MSTIAYDKPVTDLIAGLNATGHITHGNYNKTSVTFHHNGGKLSHQGVLNVWKTRPASAHFDVDASGAVAQYAAVHDYAWATGNTAGNQSSISIEMCNATLAPTWQVSETTWKSAARLAGWLFAHVIGTAPSNSNIKFHSDWLATECPGPYMRSVRSRLVAEVQAAYKAFKGGSTPPASKPAAPAAANWVAGPKVVTALQAHFKSPGKHDGKFDSQPVGNRGHFPASNWTTIQWVSSPKGSIGVKAMQKGLGVKDDGLLGSVTARALQKWAGVTQDSICGTKTVQAICKKLGVH